MSILWGICLQILEILYQKSKDIFHKLGRYYVNNWIFLAKILEIISLNRNNVMSEL